MNQKQWLAARKKGIGGSDAACILGLNPWKSNVELWEEKTRRREAKNLDGNSAVEYGKSAEAYLRGLFILDRPEYIVAYDEFGMISNNKDLPFAFATLDADLLDTFSNRHGILEVKTTEIQRSSQWDEWNGKIPQHYYIQILHQLLATGYDFAILKVQIKYTDKSGGHCAAIRHYHIERNDVLDDIEWLSEKEKTFWRYVETDQRPPLILPEI